MGNVAVFTVCCLAAWHGDEQSLFAFNDFDIVDHELIVQGNGNDRFHFPFFLHPSYSHVCYLHALILLPFPPSAPVLHPFCRNQKNVPHYDVTFLQCVAFVLLNDDLNIIRCSNMGRVGTDSIPALNDTVFDHCIITDINVI